MQNNKNPIVVSVFKALGFSAAKLLWAFKF
jgi:hypothetical protein